MIKLPPPIEPSFTEDGKAVGAADYCAYWGCDPESDKYPREYGDGYWFYNFSHQQNCPEFLEGFIPVIKRTISSVMLRQNSNNRNEDLYNLQLLLQYVKKLYRYFS